MNLCVIEYVPVDETKPRVDPAPFVAGDGVLALQDHASAGVGGGDRAGERHLVGRPGEQLCAFRRSVRASPPRRRSRVLRPLAAPSERTKKELLFCTEATVNS
jgi:hypothetical protein